MDLILQLWGGSFYLINKILFALAEGKEYRVSRLFRIYGWIIYILGVPAWVIILLGKHNWIAASIEAGGIPSMVLGLYSVYQNSKPLHRTLNRVALLFTYGSLTIGVSYSLLDYGGITSIPQVLEIGVMLGFLVGSYLLAKRNNMGWLFFMLMNGSMASLMFLQQKPLLALQQIASLGFVVYGFNASWKSKKKSSKQGD